MTWIEIDREWSSEDFEIIGAFGEGYRMFIKNIPVGESIELKVKNLRDETIVEDVEWEFREDIFMISDGNLTAIAPAIGVICAKVKIDGKTITVYSPEIAAYSTSGFCGAQNDGKNLRWEINAAESELTISGQGPMADYISVYSYDGGEFNSAPWYPYFYGVQNGLRIVVEEGVTSIGENAFYTFYGTMVGSIELPDSITDIEQSAIGYCVVLNNMLPANLHTVGSHAIFRVKDDVVYVPAGVSYLADSAFANMEDGTFCFGECEFSEAYFCGDAPAFVGDNVFGKNKEDIIIYYIEGTNGWIDSEHYNVDAGTWHGYKLEIWDTGGGDILPLKPVVSFTTDFATTATEFIEGDYIYPKLEVDENVDHYNSYWERLEDGEYVSYAVFEPDPAYSLQGMTGYGYPIWAFDEGWYRYRVQAVDSAGNAVYSDWTSFEVKPFEPRVPVTTIEIEGGAVLTPGEIAEVEVVITPPDADYRAIEWRSEDYSIVNVQPDSTSVGLTRATVTALQPGTTQIYAYTKDGDFAAALSICVTSASGTACGDNLTWSFDENTGTLTISGTGDMWDYDYLNGYAPLWGRYGDAIKRVVIENGVTSIGKDAFFNCEGLMTVEIPDSVTSVGEQAFFLCSRMTSIDLPNTLTAIDYGAFSHSGLTEVAIPAGVDYLGDDAFYGCSNLSTVAIANGVKSIGGLAFYECPALRSIDIPESVTFIGPAAFYGCSSLGSIDLPEGITAISDGTFYLCESLKSIDIPDNVTSIGFSAFAFCLELADIELPENLVVIDNDAFFFCPVLASITIPSGVTSIGNYAFEYCYSLQLIEFLGDAPSFGEETFAYVTATCLYPAGNATWTDDVMQSYGGYIGWVPVYEVLEGANSTVDTDKGEDVSIRTSGECAEFVALYVDDEAVAPENYTVTEGSTIITFKAEYLASLEDGEHFVVMYFQKGMATTTLTTRKSDYIDVPDGCAMIILAGYNGSGMLVDYKILDADVPEEVVGGDEVWAYFLDGNYVPLCAKKQLR